ncbi:hypothetical protein AVEN_137893-1 [Araneus ventricosus]|uniref:Uncharacterized protein n=1 Tax=Araneus ventricosus TaxID=182803 RepID=A0A4Y2T2E6_ARAVE|nr:hypothetical protein AVEN_212001-1 [Araneus ventricosus]GBN93322.1 hypothetical protein AVEN_46215-1 [Araneus ventricosus]GBO20322.1 hypothetical protein AVEN_22743-1 [Araneus ventricosus]GBO20324.1 hypothetical protein AVEN_137893-1 [Araneus ventricosus]
MNSTAEAVNFECPKGFSKEDAQSQLYFEDIDDDSELWLVRVPNDMDPNDLENQVISMNKHSEILGGSDGKFYECFTEKCVMPNVCLVLPHKEDRTLEEIRKPFKGSLLVTDYVMDNVVKMEAEENEPKKEPTTEEQQNGDTSPRKKSKSHKSSKENKNKEDLDLSFNLNLEDDDQASSSQQKTSKKSKKKKSRDSDSLKVEPMSDADEFPNCKSQKK